MDNEYLQAQKKWIKEVGLKNGDKVKVIVEPRSTYWETRTRNFSVGQILVVNNAGVAHNSMGLSVYYPDDGDTVHGVPFFCVVKIT